MTDHPKEQFIKMPRSLLESEAYRGIGINGHRVLVLLQLEHMRKGGKKNGELKATYQQLRAFGVSGHVNRTLKDLEDRGLILCNRFYRRATTYTLTWLGLPGGRMPEATWKTYRDPAFHQATATRSRSKSRNLRADQRVEDAKSERRTARRDPNLSAVLRVETPEICAQNCATYLEKNSNQEEQYTRYREGTEPGAVVVGLRQAGERR